VWSHEQRGGGPKDFLVHENILKAAWMARLSVAVLHLGLVRSSRHALESVLLGIHDAFDGQLWIQIYSFSSSGLWFLL
jgi:hypothetical protein